MARNNKKKSKDFKKKTDDKDQMSKRPGEEDKDDTASETKDTVRRGMSPGNDPAWYGLFPSLLRDSSTLLYSDPLGSEIRLMSRSNLSSQVTQLYFRDNSGARKALNISNREGIDSKTDAVPGICVFYLQNTLGRSRYREDPINQMANQLYTQIRYVNSGRKNYDPCDAIIYIHSIIELYAFAFWCRRLYNEAFVYSQTNFYVGRGMLEAEFVDAEDFKSNLNDFRAWLNTFILNISSYCIPSNIPYIAKKIFQYSGVYIENAFGNIKDQMYMFAPASFMSFALDEDGAGMLTPLPVQVYGGNPTPGLAAPGSRATKLKVSDVQKLGNFMLNQIILDEDFSLISGDILKAFQGAVATIDAVGEEGGIVPIFDPYVLSQFKNATILGNINRDNENKWVDVGDGKHHGGDIYQDADGVIHCGNYLIASTSSTTNKFDNDLISASIAKILTVDNPAPGPADNIEASRLTIMGSMTNLSNGAMPLVCGTEIVLGCKLITRKAHDWSEYNYTTSFTMIGDYLGNAGLAVANAAIIRSFKYAPTLILGLANSGGTALESLVPLQNVDQYTVIGIEEVEKMHRCALFSLLFVPTVAKNFNNA